jgi:hypothetical protein
MVRCSCGEEVVEGGGEEVRAEGAGLVQLRWQRAAPPQQFRYPRHDPLLFALQGS